MLSCHFLEPDLHAEYTRFIAQHPHASLENSMAWGSLQTLASQRSAGRIRLILNEKSQIIASAMEVPCRLRLGSFLWIPAGPLLPEDPLMAEACLQLFHETWKKEGGFLFVRMESLIPQTHPLANLWAHVGEPSSSAYYPRHTLCLDLKKSSQVLWEEMTQKGRYHIRKAEKAGVSIQEASTKDLHAFYSLLKKTAQRDAFAIQSQAYYESFLSLDQARLWLAFHDGHIISGAMSILFKNKWIYYFGASDAHDQKLYGSYLLQWHMIQEAQKSSCSVYDFLGIASPDNPDDKLRFVTQFKTRFGGFRESYIPARVLVLRPFATALRDFLLKIFRKIRK